MTKSKRSEKAMSMNERVVEEEEEDNTETPWMDGRRRRVKSTHPTINERLGEKEEQETEQKGITNGH